MQYRTLGKTGWKVSAIGFGAWGIGGQWGDVRDLTAIQAIRAAFDAGVNFFDVADAYGEPVGRSEELIGQALKDVRHKLLIATKVGNFARRHGHPLPYTHPLHVELCCDASLRRLATDVIDLYQCHLGNLEDPSIFLEAFEVLIKRGKIRAWGISSNNVEVVERFNREGRCASVQLDYSYVSRAAEVTLLPYCRRNNIGTIIRGPLWQGVCAGKFTADTRFTDDVRRKWNESPGRDKFLTGLAKVEKVRFLETPARTMAQGALQFVLAHDAVTTAIPGAKDAQQAQANAAAADGALTADELAQVQQITTV